MNLSKTANLTDYRAAGGDPWSTENQRILSRLVDREIVHCVSYLVSHFAQHQDALAGSDYSIDDIFALCERRHDHSERIEEIDDEIGSLEDAENAAIDAEEEAAEQTAQAAISALQTERDQLEAEQDNPDEALEHWAVTKWFAEQLAEHGETTGELFDLQIWGRTCSGQSISLDCVIAEIAAEMEILDGQRNSWKD